MSDFVLLVLLIAARLLPLAILVPAAFATSHTWRWSAGLILVLATAITPLHLETSLNLGTTTWSSTGALLRELLIGLALAFGFSVLLSALQLTSTLLGQLTGATMSAAGTEYNGVGVSALRRYFGLLALAIFVVSGGHRQLIDTLLESFDFVSPGSALPQVDVASLLGRLLAHSFATGLQAAAPVAFCLIAASTLVAVLGRGGPALGAFGMGVTVNMMVLLLVCCTSLGAMATVYQQQWTAGINVLVQAMREAIP